MSDFLSSGSSSEMAAARFMLLETFIGQAEATKRLRLEVEAAKRGAGYLPHVLLSGPPGLGKSTLAEAAARAMGTACRFTSGPALGDDDSIAGFLRGLKHGDVLFIDEIHRAPVRTMERLYPAMQDWRLELSFGVGIKARTVRATMPKFTLIGATTHPGLLPRPLRDRFKIDLALTLYGVDDLANILRGYDSTATDEALSEIASRARGTPRIAIRLLDAARSIAAVNHSGIINIDVAREALSLCGVDSLGLNELDRRYLRAIIEYYAGGPAGVNAIAAALGEDVRNLTDMIEPYLLQAGLVARTRQGRKALIKTYQHLGIKTLPQCAPSESAEEIIL